MEPFFVTLSLFDIQNSRKISADFHVDLNHQSVRAMVPGSGAQIINGASDAAQQTQNDLPESFLQYPKQVGSTNTWERNRPGCTAMVRNNSQIHMLHFAAFFSFRNELYF